MRSTLTLFMVAIIFTITACGDSAKNNITNNPPEPPAALQENESDFSLTKSRGESLIHELYRDLCKARPDLNGFEERLVRFEEDRADSLTAFDNYDSKSMRYYASATNVLDNIKDTLLKKRLKFLIEKSRNNYQQKKAPYNSLIKEINKNDSLIQDYHQALQIVVTLPAIADYQDKNKPGVKSVKNVNNEAVKLKTQIIELNKRYESKN